MTAVFVRSWKPLAWRGALGVLFGVLAFLWPQMTLALLVLLFGVYALIDGFVAIAMGTRQRAREHAWVFLLEGFAGLALGLAVFLWTRSAAQIVVHLIGLWAVATGVLELFATVRLRRELPGEVLLGVAGVASILLGFAILFRPGAGTYLLITLLGSYALVFGTAVLLQALRLRRMLRNLEREAERLRPAAHSA